MIYLEKFLGKSVEARDY